MVNDYRNTRHESILSNVIGKKLALRDAINIDRPRIRNYYDCICDKKLSYCKNFSQIYNHKCCYCGISISIIDNSLFEIDHYIPKSTYIEINEANYIDNLVYSCRYCNRNKSNYVIDEEHRIILHPDYDIYKAYYRDEQFNIRISDEYSKDEIISRFYFMMKFEAQYRRLDYLIMELLDFCNCNETESRISPIYRILYKLIKCRNKILK